MQNEMNSIDVWLGTMTPANRFRERWLTAWAWRKRIRDARWKLHFRLARELVVIGHRFDLHREGWYKRLSWRLWPRCEECGEPVAFETQIHLCSVCSDGLGRFKQWLKSACRLAGTLDTYCRFESWVLDEAISRFRQSLEVRP